MAHDPTDFTELSPIGEFNLPRTERVIYGPGKIATLAHEVERRELKRAIVVTGQTLGRSSLVAQVTSALGARCVGVFAGARQHVPRESTQQLMAEIRHFDADCLVSFGGGSPIDTSKIAIHGLLESGRALIHIAVPTTLSAGEYTSAAGVTDENTRVKRGVSDPRLLAKVVINDPLLTLETPDGLWTATGMRALDHAIESIYSVRHQPPSDVLAEHAIALLTSHLGPSIHTRGEEQVAHRGQCQMAAWYSIFGAGSTRMGISHALGHQIGPRWDVPHGVTSCITLPHVMRFMADIAPQRFGPIAAGFGVPFDTRKPRDAALACAARTADFIAELKLPTTLAAAGVPRDEIEQIVEPVWKEIARVQAVGREVAREEIVALLHAAY